MKSSIRSRNKDVISLTDVQNMTAGDLHEMSLQVLKNVTNADFRIVSLIFDNNIINLNCFKLLSGSDDLRLFIPNPVNPDYRIYILFDTVHLIKFI